MDDTPSPEECRSRYQERLAEELALPEFRPHDLFTPQTNLLLAGHYLRALGQKFAGQLPLIAAAYNGGPHNVARWLDLRGTQTTMDEFIEETIEVTACPRCADRTPG